MDPAHSDSIPQTPCNVDVAREEASISTTKLDSSIPLHEPLAGQSPSKQQIDEALDSPGVENFIRKPRMTARNPPALSSKKGVNNPVPFTRVTRSQVMTPAFDPAPSSPTWSMTNLLAEVQRRVEGMEDFGAVPAEEQEENSVRSPMSPHVMEPPPDPFDHI